MKLAGERLTTDQTLLAIIADDLNFLAWTKTKEAGNGGRFRQKSILKTLRGEEEQRPNEELVSFSSPEDLKRYLNGEK